MALLLMLLCTMIAALCTLFWYSERDGLTQTAILHQFVLKRRGDSFAIISPYAILPTLIAVITALWWGTVDSVFRIAQPFVAMSKGATASARGSGLSYQSSYLIGAAIKAARCRHGLLALITMGAFLSQIFTIAVSALFSRVLYQMVEAVVVDQPFQIREVPHLLLAPTYKVSGQQGILERLFTNMTTSFLYGALLEIRFNVSQPQWSKDEWSFIPVSVPDAHSSTIKATPDEVTILSSSLLRVEVPAVRARMECTPVAVNLDPKYYVSTANMTNGNLTAGRPIDSTGYILQSELPFGPANLSMIGNLYLDNSLSGYTSVLGNDVPFTCCAYGADDPTNFFAGHWSPTLLPGTNDYNATILQTNSNNNFTVKSLYGPGPSQYKLPSSSYIPVPLIWPAAPQLRMINCEPIFESAKAKVTIDRTTLQVAEYEILNKPETVEWAVMDDFVWRKNAITNQSFANNITTSFGNLFLSALLRAAQIEHLGGCMVSAQGGCWEHSTDRVYNYRQPGLSVDFMTYAMLSLVQDNVVALLEIDTMTRHAQTVFSIFFKHFASTGVTLNGTGGWVYQSPAEQLPPDLLPADRDILNTVPRAPSAVKQASPASISATTIDSIEMLQMSPVAFWLSVLILSWLIVTTVLVLIVKDRYFSPLLQPPDTIAGVASMLASSDRYLELARLRGASGLRQDKGFRTRLGWFRTSSGQERWGIELADHPDVHFLDEVETKEHQLELKRLEGSIVDELLPEHEARGHEMRLLRQPTQ